MTAARLAPLAPERWHPSLAALRESLGTPLNIHRVIARHPALLIAWSGLRQHVVAGSSLAPRQRELVVLRVAHLTASRYEWGHHVLRGRAAGLTDDDIARVRAGGDARGWRQDEALLLAAVDAILAEVRIPRPLWPALCARFGDEQLLDLFFTVGAYIVMAAILKTAEVPLEEGLVAPSGLSGGEDS